MQECMTHFTGADLQESLISALAGSSNSRVEKPGGKY